MSGYEESISPSVIAGWSTEELQQVLDSATDCTPAQYPHLVPSLIEEVIRLREENFWLRGEIPAEQENKIRMVAIKDNALKNVSESLEG